MRRKRTIYFNDARHYYLFVFEPPMKLEDAWIPVDECAGTAVDTFIYGVARADGLFYPSKVGMRFGADIQPFRQAAYYRLWHNMQSLTDRGLDPLTVLIDRAHDKGMDFFASLRLGGYGGMEPTHKLGAGGGGFAHSEVRDHQFAVLEELATRYSVEGIELDFIMPGMLRREDATEYTEVITEWVREVSRMVRGRPGGGGQLGARVYPNEQSNLNDGLDVRAMLREGLLDYVVPMVYGHMVVDSNLPIEWLVEPAHAADASVYPMLGPYYNTENRTYHTREWATPPMMRAAAANYWDMGADGMYTWFFKWPLDDAGRRILTEIGDHDMVKEGDKHYLIGRISGASEAAGYETPLPLEIPSSDTGTRHGIPFYVADDIEATPDRVHRVRLKVNITDLVSADVMTIRLNGESLAGETCRRDYGSEVNAYSGQWLEFDLRGVRPRKGHNLLEITLDKRPEGLVSPLVVEDVEVIVEYGSYPSTL